MNEAKRAPYVNSVESTDIYDSFHEQLDNAGIKVNELDIQTRAICVTMLTCTKHIAAMIAASHHDAHGTEQFTKPRPFSD